MVDRIFGTDLRSGNSDKNNKKGSQYSIGRNRWKSVFTGGIFVEPHMPELAEFKRYFLETVKVICQTSFVLLPFTTKNIIYGSNLNYFHSLFAITES